MNNLNNINKENNFKIPENYFDTFSQELETRISEENLKKRFGNKKPFTVPNNYFKIFSVKYKKNERKIIKLIIPWLSAAAGIIIIFALWQFLLTEVNKNKHTETNDTLISTHLNLIADNQIQINENDIEYLEPEINAYIDETDASQLYEYTNNESSDDILNTDNETVYEYFIDYADDNDYTELLAEL